MAPPYFSKITYQAPPLLPPSTVPRRPLGRGRQAADGKRKTQTAPHARDPSAGRPDGKPEAREGLAGRMC